jgi:hypothetical protein
MAAPNLPGPSASPDSSPFLPRNPLTSQYLLCDDEGYVLPHRPYRVWLSNGVFVEGYTDENGLTREIETPGADVAKVEFLKQDGDYA